MHLYGFVFFCKLYMQRPVYHKGEFQQHEGQLDTKMSLRVSASFICPLSLYLELLECLLSSLSIESTESFSSKTSSVTSGFAIFPSTSTLWKTELSRGFDAEKNSRSTAGRWGG